MAWLTLLPRWKLYMLLVIVLAALVSLVFCTGYLYGEHKAETKALIAKQDLINKQVAEVFKRDKALLEKERAHETFVAQLRATFAEQQATEKVKDAAVIADLQRGNKRLRLAVRPGSCSPAQVESQSPAQGTDAGARAELAPEASATLFGIVSDGDSAIRQLTKLQEYTVDLYKTCNSD